MTLNWQGKDRFIEVHNKLAEAGVQVYQDASGWHCSDPLTAQVIIDSHDQVAIERAKKWEEIKDERDRRKELGVTIAGKKFHSDASSRIQQLALVMMGSGIPAGLQWKTMDGSFVTMTPALANQVFAGMAAFDQALFKAAEVHRATMSELLDPMEIRGYSIAAGWPAP